MGLQILRLDGKNIEWKEATLRHLIVFLLTIFCSILMIDAILRADETTFAGLSWLKQSQYLMSLSYFFCNLHMAKQYLDLERTNSIAHKSQKKSFT